MNYEYYLFGLIAAILVLLLLRPVYLWYFKIDRVVELLERISELLISIDDSLYDGEDAEPKKTNHNKDV